MVYFNPTLTPELANFETNPRLPLCLRFLPAGAVGWVERVLPRPRVAQRNQRNPTRDHFRAATTFFDRLRWVSLPYRNANLMFITAQPNLRVARISGLGSMEKI
jgi:hypothetical protein